MSYYFYYKHKCNNYITITDNNGTGYDCGALWVIVKVTKDRV